MPYKTPGDSRVMVWNQFPTSLDRGPFDALEQMTALVSAGRRAARCDGRAEPWDSGVVVGSLTWFDRGV